MGRSKVFLRRRAFEALEHLRSKKLENAATKIQSGVRMYFAKVHFIASIYAVIVIQNFIRRIGAYRLMQAQRLVRSSLVIQCAWRCSQARHILLAARCIAWWCQSTFRGAIARQYCAYLFLDRKASAIQRAWRKYNSSRTFRKIRRTIVCLQNRHRARIAKEMLYKLRREAKDLSVVAAERDKFRNESLRLRKELEEAKKSPSVIFDTPRREEKAEEIKQLRLEVQRLQMELEKAHRMSTTSTSQENEVRILMEELARREEHLETLKKELMALRSRDDSFSGRSVTNEACSSPSIARGRLAFDSPVGPIRGSPARSDVSLLDKEAEEEDHCFADDARSMASLREQIVPSTPLPVSTDQEMQDLHASIRQGNRQSFDELLRQTSEICLLINQGDHYGRTALHLAVLTARLDMAETLISKGAVVNAQDEDGETPLHLAENVFATEFLLKKGKANPNIPNVDGICAIHLAVQRRDIDSVRALLRHGANVNNADNIRWFTPLHLVALPARREEDEKPAEDIRSRIAQLLSGYGPNRPDLDYQDSEGNAPLHYSAQVETAEAYGLVDVLLENGADPNIRNERDQSPLHLLCHNAELRKLDVYHDTLGSMLSHGADPNQQSMTGCTPLHLSLYHKDINSAVQLVSSGAEIHLCWKKVSKKYIHILRCPSTPSRLCINFLSTLLLL